MLLVSIYSLRALSLQEANDDLDIVLLDQSIVESFKVRFGSEPPPPASKQSIESTRTRNVVPYSHVRFDSSPDAVCLSPHGGDPEALPGLDSAQGAGHVHGGNQEPAAPRGIHSADLRSAQDRGRELCEYAPLPAQSPVRNAVQRASTMAAPLQPRLDHI